MHRAAPSAPWGGGQQVPEGAETPVPTAGSSTSPPPERRIAPRWTTYHTPRHEIMEAMPMERVCPSSWYTTRELATS